jgi:hypothetical protein
MDYYKVSDCAISIIKSEWIIKETKALIVVSFPPYRDTRQFKKSALFDNIEDAKAELLRQGEMNFNLLKKRIAMYERQSVNIFSRCSAIEGSDNSALLECLEKDKYKRLSLSDD